MKESTKTIILVLLLSLGIATIFWGRYRLKAALHSELAAPAASQSTTQ